MTTFVGLVALILFVSISASLSERMDRGGHKQRKKRRTQAAESNDTDQVDAHSNYAGQIPSPMFLWLVNQWSSGVLSAPSTQQCAKAAVLSGCSAPDVCQIARVGAHGESPQNCQRDLVRQLCHNMASPEPFCWKVPLVARDKEELTLKVEQYDVYIFLPHDWLACLNDSCLQEKVLGTHLTETFWSQQCLEDPKLCDNPVLKIPRFKQVVVPFLVHGDGAQFAERDSLMVISMKSILSHQTSVAASQLLLAAIPKKCTSKSADKSLDTWEVIWSVLKWSFTAMFHGVHPLYDPVGKPWPEDSERAILAGKQLLGCGIKGWIYTLAGDLDYLCNHYRLDHFASNSPCFFCACNWQDVSPFDFRPVATWRTTIPTPARRRLKPSTDHPVMDIPGVSVESCGLDCLHVLELGLVAHLIGSLFFELCYFELQGTRMSCLAQLFQRILQIYDEHGIKCRIGTLKYEYFCDVKAPHKHYPCLHASAIKGRETRYLVPVALELAKENNTSQHSGHRVKCFEHLNAVYELLDLKVFHFTPSQQQQFQDHMHKCLLHYLILHKEAAAAGKKIWNMTMKSHYAAHIAMQAEYCNPRVNWCYGSESMVGHISRLAQSCLSGTAAHLVSESLMTKYRISMHILFSYFAEDAEEL